MSLVTGGSTSFVSDVSSEFSIEDKVVASNLKGKMWKAEVKDTEMEQQRRHTFTSLRGIEQPVVQEKKYRFVTQ